MGPDRPLSTKKFSIWGPIGEFRPLLPQAAGYMTKGHMGPTGKFKSQISGNLCRVHKIGISNLFILTVDFFENSGFIDHCRPDKQVFGSLFEKKLPYSIGEFAHLSQMIFSKSLSL